MSTKAKALIKELNHFVNGEETSGSDPVLAIDRLTRVVAMAALLLQDSLEDIRSELDDINEEYCRRNP